MQVDSPENIRNITLAGHADTGKTTLASAVLYTGGVVNRMNRVEDGNTTTDFDPLEIDRGYSIGLAPCFVPWKKHKINVVDVPGAGIFGVESRAGVRATDAPVLLFLHADTRLPDGWAAAVRGALADPGVAGGAFGFRFEGSGPRLRWIEWGVRLRLAVAGLPYGDQALFLRRDVLDAMGGVPQVPIMEDLDLARGIRAAGRLALLPLPVRTSARRYLAAGVLRTWLRNAAALAAWQLGLDRERVAAWYQR